MTRLTLGLAVAGSLYAVTAVAQTQAEIADRENEEGKELMFANKMAEASAKFQSAVARVPEPKYFFNLCTSRFAEGKFGEALTACNAADKNADQRLKEKTAKLVAKIREEAKAQGLDPEATGGGGGPGETPPVTDPNNPPVTDPNDSNSTPPPNTTGTPPSMVVGRPPSVGLFTSVRPENKYTWSLGVDLYAGGGRFGQSGYYGKSTGGIRFKGDYMLKPAQRIGAQGYFQLTHFGDGNDMGSQGAYALDVFDIGLAAYKHICGPRARLCLTPLVGAQLAMLSPTSKMESTASQVFNYASLGARVEAGLSYALGSRYEHVLSAAVGLNAYTAVFAEPMDASSFTAEEWGLDKGGATFYVGLGYTYRFDTPFGSAPFITLE
jgi:hypothetical protein